MAGPPSPGVQVAWVGVAVTSAQTPGSSARGVTGAQASGASHNQVMSPVICGTPSGDVCGSGRAISAESNAICATTTGSTTATAPSSTGSGSHEPGANGTMQLTGPSPAPASGVSP